MKCFAEKYCKKDRSSCSDICGGYRVLRALFNNSRIPERYRYNIPLVPSRGDLPSFEELNRFMHDIRYNVEAGKNLYIWGRHTGNGKTSWACKIMGHYFRKIAFRSGLENEGLYIYTPSFFEELRGSYEEKAPGFESVLEMVYACSLLIIDDIGEGNPTEWVRERLTCIVNDRVGNGRSMIFTSGLSPQELGEKLGSKLYSRVMMNTEVVNITGGDRRGI